MDERGRDRGQLLVHTLPDAGDRLVDRLLGREAIDGGPVDDLALEPPPVEPPALQARLLLPGEPINGEVRLGHGLYRRAQPVRVARIEPERLVEQLPRR